MKKNKIPTVRKSAGAVSRTLAAAFPRLTLECLEKYELLICGCRKIALYSEEETVLCTCGGKVRVRGKNLRISFLGDGKIKLSGVISAIEFI